MPEKWDFWIDRGGTFTDVVARRPEGGYLSHKLLSENPEQYPDAALQGIRDLLGVGKSDPIPTERIAAVKMGTTVGTNALLERKGDRTLLVINEGFHDALRIGYQNRPHLFELNIQLPEMLYERVLEITGRYTARSARPWIWTAPAPVCGRHMTRASAPAPLFSCMAIAFPLTKKPWPRRPARSALRRFPPPIRSAR